MIFLLKVWRKAQEASELAIAALAALLVAASSINVVITGEQAMRQAVQHAVTITLLGA